MHITVMATIMGMTSVSCNWSTDSLSENGSDLIGLSPLPHVGNCPPENNTLSTLPDLSSPRQRLKNFRKRKMSNEEGQILACLNCREKKIKVWRCVWGK